MTVAAHARGASAIAVVDRLGNVPAGVPALVVRAGRHDEEIAGPLLDADVRNAPALEHLDGHPHGHMAHKLAARRARAIVVLEQAAFEPVALARRHDDPELRCAGVQVVERVEKAVFHVQLERLRAGGAADVKVRVVDAGDHALRQLLLEAAAAPIGER